MVDFVHRDPSQAAFWDERFAAAFTPWDARGAPPAFVRWLQSASPPAGRVLIPGCGSAYEVALLVEHGCDVLAIDYSELAVELARRAQPAFAEHIVQADFFVFEAAPFDVIYERAFLAALPPRLWPAWAQGCARLVRAGGQLAGFFFVGDAVAEPRRGPPFASTAQELSRLLEGAFELVVDQPIDAAESLPVFAGRERWQQWRRR